MFSETYGDIGTATCRTDSENSDRIPTDRRIPVTKRYPEPNSRKRPVLTVPAGRGRTQCIHRATDRCCFGNSAGKRLRSCRSNRQAPPRKELYRCSGRCQWPQGLDGVQKTVFRDAVSVFPERPMPGKVPAKEDTDWKKDNRCGEPKMPPRLRLCE